LQYLSASFKDAWSPEFSAFANTSSFYKKNKA
jgi:hypothetical protein